MEKSIEPSWNIENQWEKEYKEKINDIKFDILRKFAPLAGSINSKVNKYIDEYWTKFLFAEVEKDDIIITYTLAKDEESRYSINIDYELEEWDPRVNEYKSNDEFITLNESQTEKYLKIFEFKY